MDNEQSLRIGMAIHKIAMTVSEEDLKKITPYLKDIENTVLEVTKKEDKNE